MLDKIIRFSLNNRYIILLCSLLLVVFGVRTASEMDVRGRLEHINEVISVITDDLPPLKAKIEQYLSEMK